jgi:hypothetical protein
LVRATLGENLTCLVRATLGENLTCLVRATLGENLTCLVRATLGENLNLFKLTLYGDTKITNISHMTNLEHLVVCGYHFNKTKIKNLDLIKFYVSLVVGGFS